MSYHKHNLEELYYEIDKLIKKYGRSKVTQALFKTIEKDFSPKRKKVSENWRCAK